jgi:hypothetical protein
MLQSLCDAVDGALLMRHIGEFARWIKLSGSEGEADSLRYVRPSFPSLLRSGCWKDSQSRLRRSKL